MDLDRIHLRLRTPAIMYGVLQMNREEQNRFFGFPSEERMAYEIENIRSGAYENMYAGRWFDFLLKETQEVIGSGGYHTWWQRHDRAEIGYWLNDDLYKRRGFMNEILPALLKYGFEEMNLFRIEAFTAEDNIPSIHLLEKFRFQREALVHGRYKIGNAYEDDLLFYLLKDRWKNEK